MTSEGPDSKGGIAGSLAAELAVVLPGLGPDELSELAQAATIELQSRVGSALDAHLTRAQRAEFRQLSDNSAECTRWMEATLPYFRATTAIERSALIAQIVRTVLTEDPAAARVRPSKAVEN